MWLSISLTCLKHIPTINVNPIPNRFPSKLSNPKQIISFLITGCVIWILSPVDNPSKELDVVEHKVYRRRTRLVLVVEGSILLLALYFQLDFVTKSIVIAYFIVSVSLLMGLISNKSKQISVHKI